MNVYYRKKFLPPALLGLLLFCCFAFAWQANNSPAAAAEMVSLPAQTVAPGEATLTVNLQLPEGCKLNQEAPSTLGLKTADAAVMALEEKYAQNLPVANLPMCLTVPVKEGKTAVQAAFRLNFCDEKIGLCFFKEAVVNLPVEVSKTSTNKKMEIVYKPQMK
jgi:hypothetical protein